MAILIGTNLKYEGPYFLDDRNSIENIADLKTLNINSLPDGFEIYCKEANSWYSLNKKEEEDSLTGKFHKRSYLEYIGSKSEEVDKTINERCDNIEYTASNFRYYHDSFVNNAFPWILGTNDTSFSNIIEIGDKIVIDYLNIYINRSNTSLSEIGLGNLDLDKRPEKITCNIYSKELLTYNLIEKLGEVILLRVNDSYVYLAEDLKTNPIELIFNKPTFVDLVFSGSGNSLTKTILTDYYSSAGFLSFNTFPDNTNYSGLYQSGTKFETTMETKFKNIANFKLKPVEEGKYFYAFIKVNDYFLNTDVKNNYNVFINNQPTTNFSVRNINCANKYGESYSHLFKFITLDYPINTTDFINVRIEKKEA